MKNLLLLLSLFGFFMFTTSCGDDDVDCDALEEQLEDLEDDLSDSCYSDFDCDDCKEAVEALLDLYDTGQSCIEEEDKEYYEEYRDSLEDALDDLDC